tara:strand:- start:111 stop:758 length:648 start_codon:yes stop_codon:yes gene_type:complete
MKIQILISKGSWANKYRNHIRSRFKKFANTIKILDNHKDLKKKYNVNIVFSYFKIIPKKYLLYSKNNLITHESKVPKGKGMSPLTWQILKNKNKIFFSLLEADTKIDSGTIYYRKKVKIKKDLLFDEIKKIQLIENLKLLEKFLKFLKRKKRAPKSFIQVGKSTYFKKRLPKDSKIDINESIRSQFNLLRVSDSKNYPTFFKMYGKKYKIIISKL